MAFIERKIPPYIYRKSNVVSLVVFTAIFALFFINFYEPFNSKEWYDISKFQYFAYSSLLILTGVLVVVISRAFMFYYTKKHTISYWEYAIWIVAEIFLMSIFYTFISYTLNENREFGEVFKASIKNTSLVLLLPYTIMHLYFALQENANKLRELKDKKIKDDEGEDINKKNEIISFHDDKGELRLSIKRESLLYMESADNYVAIWYMGKQGVTNFLLRNTLKTIEEKFTNTNIIRCHRSFMVNLDQVKVAKKTKNGIYLDIGVDRVPEIPVSKSYGEKVTKWLLSSMS